MASGLRYDVMFLAEKGKQAERIARALADGGVSRRRVYGVSVFEFEVDGLRCVAVPARGHLYEVYSPDRGYPVLRMEWRPVAGVKDAPRYIRAIVELYRRSRRVVVCTDYDIEGELIGGNLLEYAIGVRDLGSVDRMKFSSLTRDEIQRAWRKLSKLDLNMLDAGRARHEVDYLWGISFSRALMTALKLAEGWSKSLSAGRVQTPMLIEVVRRELERQRFKPKPYWEVYATIQVPGGVLEAACRLNPFWSRDEAEEACRRASSAGYAVVAGVDRRRVRRRPPPPFDTTELQRECFRHFGLPPDRVIEEAEAIYLAGAISYPRTDSQRYPPGLDHRKVLKGLASAGYGELARRLLEKRELKPVEGRKGGEESAHPAIYPTGVKPEGLTKTQMRIYDLIVRRYMATLADDAIRETVSIRLDVGGVEFRATGSRTVYEGWLRYYRPYAGFAEVELPSLKAGERLRVGEVKLEEKETKPPPRYTPMKLVLWAEENGIGTKATRGEMVKKLLDRGYVVKKGSQLVPTQLGVKVAEVIESYCPPLASVEMTRELEGKLLGIQSGELSRSEVLKEAASRVEELVYEFNSRIKAIGRSLAEGVRESTGEYIGVCSRCGKRLKLIRRRDGKRFIWCTTRDCTYYPLPRRGRLKVLDYECPNCGLKVISVRERKGRWVLCVKCGPCSRCARRAECKSRFK